MSASPRPQPLRQILHGTKVGGPGVPSHRRTHARHPSAHDACGRRRRHIARHRSAAPHRFRRARVAVGSPGSSMARRRPQAPSTIT